MNFSQIIRRLVAQGMSQAEIGRRVGLTRAAICNLAGRKDAEPSGNAAVRLWTLYMLQGEKGRARKVA